MPEQAEQRDSELLGQLSHELRTPLNAVLGMLELSFNEPLSEELRDYLTTAYHSARSLVKVLDDLVDLARAQRGELDPETTPFALRAALAAAVAPLEADAHARGARFVLRVAGNVPDRVHGSESGWRKIAAHLTEHVLRSTTAGTITIDVAPVSRSGRRLELALGVCDDEEPHHGWAAGAILAARGDGTERAAAPHHSGKLPLVISHEWVEHLGGVMWCDPAHPARVACSVQLQEAPAGESDSASTAGQRPAAPRLDQPTRHPLHVLVVDDVPANRKVVQAILTRRGHRVALANTGRQAVERVRRDNFDVVLMDAQMPAMSGLDAAARIRRLPHHARDVPIVAVTADAIDEDRRACLAAGMDDYLSKPVSAAALVACVEAYGDFQATVAPAAALARLGGDESLLRELIRLFREDAPGVLARLQAGLAAGDAVAVAHAAHNLRGLALNLNAQPTVDASLLIERLAGGGRHAELAAAAADLERKLARLDQVLQVHERRLQFRLERGQQPSQRDGPQVV